MVKKNNTKIIIGISAGPIIVITTILIIIFLPDLVGIGVTPTELRLSDLADMTTEAVEIAESDGQLTMQELEMIAEQYFDELEKIITENITNTDSTDDIPIISLFTTEKFALESEIVLTDSIGNEISRSLIETQFQPQTLISQEGDIIDLGSINIKINSIIPQSKINIDSPASYVLDGKINILLNGFPLATKAIFNDGLFPSNPQPVLIADSRSSPFSERQNDFTFEFSKINQEILQDGVHLFSIELTELQSTVLFEGIEERFFTFNNTEIYRLEIQSDESRIVEINEQGQLVQVVRSDSEIVLCAYGANGGTVFANTVTTIPETTIEVGGEIIHTEPSFSGVATGPKYNNVPLCKIVPGIPRDTDIIVKVGTLFTLEGHTPTYQKTHFVACPMTGWGDKGCDTINQSIDPNVPKFITNEDLFIESYKQLGFIP